MTRDYCIADHFTCKQYAFDFFDSEMQFLLTKCSIRENLSDNTICIAVSGGSDSMALLAMFSYWSWKNNVKISCVTVDHKLRKESGEEAIFVQNFCETLGVKHTILEWNRHPTNENAVLCDNKIEDLARDARYRLISEFCKKNFIRVLLTGHTWNDQLETFEIRKDSGSSSFGLAGISRIRTISNDIKLVRPVLHFTREYLQKFLINEKINWKKDPMNDCVTFKRVVCRRKILTYDNKKLMDFYKNIKMLGKIRGEIEEAAVSFLKDEKKCFFSDFGYADLNFSSFDVEKTNVQVEIIKRVIWNIGGKKYTTNINEDILQKIISNKINTIGRCLLKINKKSISVFRENRNFIDIKIEKSSDFSRSYIFDNRFLIKIKEKSFLNDDLSNIVISSCYDYQLKHKKEFNCNYLDDLPRNAIFGLPCVFRNNKIIAAYGMKHESEEISFGFIHKMNLFDVFLH